MIAWENWSSHCGRRGRLSAGIDPLRGDRHAAGRRRRRAQGRLGQYRGDQCARTGRKDLALITLIGDGGKGAIAVLIARYLVGDTAAAVAGGAAFLGHLFPIWLKFKGGKGVATFLGTMLAAAWPVGLLDCATWMAMAGLFRISSLAALTAAALTPLFCFATDQPYPVSLLLSIGMAVLMFIRHHANIARLLKGQEPRIGRKAQEPPRTPA